jgi:hypothetical protein
MNACLPPPQDTVRKARFARRGFRYPGGLVRRVVYWLLVAGLLGFQGAVMVTSALQETQTYDEGIHLAAGYTYLKTGEYHFNCEHPPLGKLLAALALLPLKPHVPLEDVSWQAQDQRDFARAFLYRNRVPADALLLRGRLTTMLVTLGLGLALAVWTRRHFGAGAGLLAVFLYALDPNITAHGRYVTNDLLITLLTFLAIVAWGTWLKSGRRRDLWWAALALALALVSKYSALFLIPTFAVLYLVEWWQRGGRFGWRRAVMAGLTLSVVSVGVIAMAYWRETWRLTFGGPAKFVRLDARIERLTRPGGWFYEAGKRYGLPAYSYLVGMDSAMHHDREGHSAYLLGQRSRKGWWYYFPVAFAVKTPTAVWLLGLLGLALAAGRVLRPPWRRLYGRLRGAGFEWYLLALPAVGYFALWMRSSVNLGLRHILPVYPFLFVLVAAAALRLWPPRWRRALPVVLCAAAGLQACESLAIYPHYLAFFNLPSGGPLRGPEYLADSNIDWGQDLKHLKAWHEAHGKPRLCLLYFGQAPPAYYGLEFAEDWLPPTWDLESRKTLHCVAAVSVTILQDVYSSGGDLLWLRQRQPLGQVGYSIYLYDLLQRQTAP